MGKYSLYHPAALMDEYDFVVAKENDDDLDSDVRADATAEADEIRKEILDRLHKANFV